MSKVKLAYAYDNRPYRRGDGFCACCGATVVLNATEKTRTTTRGIRVILDKVGSERLTDKVEVKHINTRNGPVTVAVKFKE